MNFIDLYNFLIFTVTTYITHSRKHCSLLSTTSELRKPFVLRLSGRSGLHCGISYRRNIHVFRLCEKISVNSKTVIKTLCCEWPE